MIKQFENFNSNKTIYILDIKTFNCYVTDETEIIDLVKEYYKTNNHNIIDETSFELIKNKENNIDVIVSNRRLHRNIHIKTINSLESYKKEQSQKKFNL